MLLALAGIVIGIGCAMLDCVADAQITLWHSALGRHYYSLCGRSVRSVRIAGEFPPGAASGVSRSDYSVACGVN